VRRNPLRRAPPGLYYALEVDGGLVRLTLVDGTRGNVIAYMMAIRRPMTGPPVKYVAAREYEGPPRLVVEDAAAEEGYGPLLYELMAYLGKTDMGITAGLMPSRVRSPEAKAFWRRRHDQPFMGLPRADFEALFGVDPEVIQTVRPEYVAEFMRLGSDFFDERYGEDEDDEV